MAVGNEIERCYACESPAPAWGAACAHPPSKISTALLGLVSRRGRALKFIPSWLLTYDVCLAAVRQNGKAVFSVPQKLQTAELWAAAVLQSATVRGPRVHVPEKFLIPEFCLAVVRQRGGSISWFAPRWRTAQVCMAAVQQDGQALNFVPDELLTEEICEAAVRQSGWAFQYVPSELRTPELSRLASVTTVPEDVFDRAVMQRRVDRLVMLAALEMPLKNLYERATQAIRDAGTALAVDWAEVHEAVLREADHRGLATLLEALLQFSPGVRTHEHRVALRALAVTVLGRPGVAA